MVLTVRCTGGLQCVNQIKRDVSAFCMNFNDEFPSLVGAAQAEAAFERLNLITTSDRTAESTGQFI